MHAIRKFNGYCASLAAMYKSEWVIPLPEPLPTQLGPLRDCPHLMEDVWITKSSGDVPPWLCDPDVREGIRAMLKIDRCQEERRRLGMEADNLCRFFGRELCAIEVAIATPSSMYTSPSISDAFSCFFPDIPLLVLLQQRHTHLLNLKQSWSNNPLVSRARYDIHVTTAAALRQNMSNTHPEANPFTWIPLNPNGYQAVSVHSQASDMPPVLTSADSPFTSPFVPTVADLIITTEINDDDADGAASTDLHGDDTLLQDYLEDASDTEECDVVAGGPQQGEQLEIIWKLPVRIFSLLCEYISSFLSFSIICMNTRTCLTHSNSKPSLHLLHQTFPAG